MSNLVPLQPNDVVKLRKHWRKYAKNTLEEDIVNAWLREKRDYIIVRTDNNIEDPMVKLAQDSLHSQCSLPFYYTRAMFRKVTLPSNHKKSIINNHRRLK